MIAGSGVTVAGGSPDVLDVGRHVGQRRGPDALVTVGLANDTGASASDAVTNDATLTGTADPGATMQFTVDGPASRRLGTVDADGAWSFTPTGLTDGAHTIVASELIGTTLMGSAATSFTLRPGGATVVHRRHRGEWHGDAHRLHR